MIIETIVWGIVIYLAYKFIFGLVLPVKKAADQMKDNIRKMQETQQSTTNPSSTEDTHTQAKTDNPASKAGEYIDYEDVK